MISVRVKFAEARKQSNQEAAKEEVPAAILIPNKQSTESILFNQLQQIGESSIIAKGTQIRVKAGRSWAKRTGTVLSIDSKQPYPLFVQININGDAKFAPKTRMRFDDVELVPILELVNQQHNSNQMSS